jgi:Zn-dependent protease with chaperone function
MILSYWPRLLSLCFASFFLVHVLVGLAVRFAERRIIGLAERIKARAAARLLFWVRIVPVGIAVVVVAFACAPSYVRFEGNIAFERVGFACLSMACLGALVWAAAIGRGLRIAIHSTAFTYRCRRNGSMVRLAGRPSRMLVIQTPRPFLVQSGILRPYIVISQRLLTDFSGAELDAALGHERAHWLSRDNSKRLVLAFLPGILPFWRAFETLERNWSKFAERTADDVVIAEGAGPALSLASALVRLARMPGTTGPPLSLPRGASLLGGSDDLSGRVHRLLAPDSAAGLDSGDHGRLLWAVGAVLTAIFLTALASPLFQRSLHELLERLLR